MPATQILSFAADWLNLILRWSHVVIGIGWIGASFYFISLDLSLRKLPAPEGVAGTAWEVHGGGFYRVDKYAIAPKELPPELVWFRWEAYLTWITGFALLILQYYIRTRDAFYLIQPSVLRPEAGAGGDRHLADQPGDRRLRSYDRPAQSDLRLHPPTPGRGGVRAHRHRSRWIFGRTFSGRGAR